MKNWFKPIGWIYYPVSVIGWVITLFIAAVFIHDFLFVNSRAHSISDMYYEFIPYGGIYIIAYLWLASKTSVNKNDSA